MSTLLSFEQVYDQLLAAQQVLNPNLQRPITNRRALLILSRQVSSVMLADEEALVLEFFGLFWVLEVDLSITGFFPTEEQALDHLRAQIDSEI